MPEAAAELLRYGFEELGLACIWCSHYTENSQSRRVIEKCGFVHFLDGAVLDEPTGEERPARFYALTREQWAEQNVGPITPPARGKVRLFAVCFRAIKST